MTDLITAEEAEKLLDECDGDDCLTCEYARTVIALHAQLADAQAAQAMVVERAAEVMDQKWFIEDSMRDAIKAEIRALATIDGLALVQELRAERDAASAVAAAAYGATLDWEQILEDDALWQAQDDIAKSRVACMTAEADRDRLSAENAVLEAKVAGLLDAIRDEMKTRSAYAVGSGGATTAREKFAAWSAASERLRVLATQEAGI